MRKKLQLAFSLYSPYMGWEIILVIQIVVFLGFSTLMISNFVRQNDNFRAFQSLFSAGDYYFQPYDRFVEMMENPEVDGEIKAGLIKQRDELLEQIAPGAERGAVFNTHCEVNGQEYAEFYGYNEVLARRIGLDAYWEAAAGEAGAVPVLVRGRLARQYQTGDHFDMAVGDEWLPVRAVVAGYLEDGFGLIKSPYGATRPGIDGFFGETDIMTSDPLARRNAVVAVYDHPEEWMESLINPAVFIFSDNEAAPGNGAIPQDGSAGGLAFNMIELTNNAILDHALQNRTELSGTIAAGLFTGVSLFGYVFLLFIRNQRQLGVYTVLGMSRRTMMAVILLALGLLAAAAVLIYGVGSALCIRLDFFPSEDFQLRVIGYSILLVALSLAVGMGVCCGLIARRQPVDYLRGD